MKPKDPNKWALLIGIDCYPNFRHLGGCANDVRAMAQLLKKNFKFSESNITELLDEAATQEGIRNAWEQLIGRVGQGDVVVIQFSGHGSQIRDREGDEADGWDETIVPFDSAHENLPNRDISDDEIYAWLLRLTAVTPYVTLIFDCCHSGTITRDPFGSTARWVPPDKRPVEELPPSPVLGRAPLESYRDAGPSGWLPRSKGYTLIAGCRSDELSHEVEIGTDEKYRQGALTYFLVQELRKARPGTTYRDVFEAVAPRVTAYYRSQHPQLEGAWDREIFGLRDIEPMRFLPVRERKGERVVLGGGIASGVTKGSVWSVYPGATKTTNGETRLGTLEVVEAWGATSHARIVAEVSAEAVRTGTRAVEEQSGGPGLAVEVVTPPKLKREGEKLLDELRKSPIVRPVKGREKGDVRAYLLTPREQAGPGDPVPRLGRVSQPTWVLVGKGDDVLAPLHGVGERDAVSILRENLEKLARYRYALELEGPDGPLKGAVTLSLLRQRRNGTWISANGGKENDVELFEEDALGFKITNHSPFPLYLALLDFGLAGRVELIYPARGTQDPLQPGRSIKIGTDPGTEMKLGIPEEFPLNPWDSRMAGGVETVKLFAATQELDLNLLSQTSYRGARGVSSLNLLLRQALAEQAQPEVTWRDVRTQSHEDLWTTTQRSFRLRPRPTAKS